MGQKQIDHSLVKERTFKTEYLKRSLSTKPIQVGIKRTGIRRSILRIILLFVISILFSTHLQSQEEVFDIIFKQDFESSTPGYYTRGEWSRDWNSPPWENGLEVVSRAEWIMQYHLNHYYERTESRLSLNHQHRQ